jgi:hypothetical protein
MGELPLTLAINFLEALPSNLAGISGLSHGKKVIRFAYGVVDLSFTHPPLPSYRIHLSPGLTPQLHTAFRHSLSY